MYYNWNCEKSDYFNNNYFKYPDSRRHLFGLCYFKPYTIGIIFSQGSAIGKEEFLAARFFADEFKKTGTHPVRLLYFSPESNEESFREACGRLKTEDVSVIIGAGLSWEGVILAEELRDTGIPIWGIASTSYLSNKKDNFFRIVPDVEVISTGFMSQFKEHGYSRVRVIRSVINEEYSYTILEHMQSVFKGEISDEYFSEDISFVPGDGVDAVFCICHALDLAEIVSRIGDAGYSEAAVYTSDWGFDELVTKFRMPEMEGVLSIGIKGIMLQPYRDKLDDFSESMNTPVTYGSIFVYNLLEIINEALSRVGDKPDKLMAEFSHPAYYNSGYCEIFVNEYGDAMPEKLFVRRISGGEIEIVEVLDYEGFPVMNQDGE